MTNSMDTRPLLTAEDLGLAVGDTVRFDERDPDWCKLSGVFGKIDSIKSWYSSAQATGIRIQLIKVISEDKTLPIITGVSDVTKVRPIYQYDWEIGPQSQEETMEDAWEERQADMMTAQMLGFNTPEDEGFEEALAEMEAQYSVRNEYPVGQRVLVYTHFGRNVVGEGIVAGHKPGMWDFGGPEDGPGPVRMIDLVIVKMDDGSTRFEMEGTLVNRTCPKCDGLVESKDAHTGYDPTTVYNCRNCDWKDMA
jgi:hypothetical protein